MHKSKKEDRYLDLFLDIGNILVDSIAFQMFSEPFEADETESTKVSKIVEDKLEAMKKLEPNESYIYQIKRKLRLTRDEMKLLSMVVAFEMLPYRTKGEVFNSKLTGELVLRALFSSRSQMLRMGTKLLGKASKLVKSSLIDVNYEHARSIFDVSISASREFLENVLGSEFFIRKDKLRNDVSDEGLFVVYEPRVSLEDVVLSKQKKELIRKVVSQVFADEIIFEQWGMKEVVGYGRGVIMLFWGPPGTGKTLTAEAIAKETGRKLAYARMDRLVSSYVGETERNIYEMFSKVDPKEHVLLIDEADGMLYTREGAMRSWEIREINVLLQAMERFNGIMILTTNNELVLDKALERRVSLKLKFEMPSFEERKLIWKHFLTKGKLPIGRIDYTKLAKYELTGGHIKNAVLNALRELAYLKLKGREVKLTTGILERYAKLEESKRTSSNRIGF